MSTARTLFRIMRAVGLLAFLVLFLRSEYMFFNGNPALIVQWKIHLFAVGSILLIPLGWVPFVLIIVGQWGKWWADRRMKKDAAAPPAEQTAA